MIYPRIDVKRLANDSTGRESRLSSAGAAQTIVAGLKGAGINLVATLPDINLSDLLREVEEDRDFIHVPLCREEEGIGICAGAYLVGKKSVDQGSAGTTFGFAVWLARQCECVQWVEHSVASMKRFDCLAALAAVANDALIVSSAGAMTLEWNYLRPSDGNFRVRTLGLCSSIALGMALGLPRCKIVALDGDGSLLMNLCSLPTIARMRPKNLIHIVFDNEVYEASGSKKTATGTGTDLVGVARAAGIENSLWANSSRRFRKSCRCGNERS